METLLTLVVWWKGNNYCFSRNHDKQQPFTTFNRVMGEAVINQIITQNCNSSHWDPSGVNATAKACEIIVKSGRRAKAFFRKGGQLVA